MAGVYVHIPFCVQKCIYCAFNSYADKGDLAESYINAVKKELSEYPPFSVDTIYFGGGTPTIISEEFLTDILKFIFDFCEVAEDAEITVEANPGTVNSEKLISLRKAGFNRISFGIQSFSDKELKMLSRIHTANDGEEAVCMARKAGFSNISADFMTALPGQSMKSLDDTLDKMLSLNLEHISVYSLTVEEGTSLYRNRDKYDFPDEDTEREMYHRTVQRLKQAGYVHYEISNFAKPGFESKHNSAYWTGEEYVGLGAGAHSYFGGRRYSNTDSPEDYINGAPYENVYVIDEDEKKKEHIFLGLRMMRGIRYEKNPKIDKMISLGLLKLENGYVSLTERGVDISNYVLSELI